uniref:CAAX prenyl protease 2/Lysostaphin resistance protein A-like domain-containing protein n=1 Tax=Compsopogon caeruleus TaxID=31354 RepID=A0A7S1XHH8_9RHOD
MEQAHEKMGPGVSQGAESPPGEMPDAQRELDDLERPQWAPAWMPDQLIRMHPILQLAVLLGLYAIHLLFISKKTFPLPRQLIPNDKGLLNEVGLDSIVGYIVILVVVGWRKIMKLGRPFPNLLQSENPPWKVPRQLKRTLAPTTGILIVSYLASGYGAVFCEQVLCLLSVYGVPLTIPTLRAWKVLLGHLMWVYMGIRILNRRLSPFFPPKGTWLRWKWNANWLWWSIGGYAVSALLFNCADVVNQFILPSSVFSEESVVNKLVNPENRDLFAMGIGSIGPCMSAPIFEEVLYRGFLLPALTAFFPLSLAIPVSSVLFAIHHLNLSGVLPLSVLGLAWAIIYTQSRNLVVTILIHAMWNSRVFLVSLLGL